MAEEKRASFGSRFGFIMTMAGFSIGLGNIWRFPYLTGTNGGGAFVLVYLIIAVLISIPLFWMEMELGRKTKCGPIEGMRKLTGGKGKIWNLFGWTGVLAAFFILTYYVQIMGWIIDYLVKIVSGQLKGLENPEAYAKVFNNMTESSTELFLFTAIAWIIVIVISARGLEGGVEKACKFMLPTLMIILIGLAIRSLTLPGAMEGVVWYLKPDFSKINGSVLLAALGQSFFSIGIASGGAFIYGSYLKDDASIPTDGILCVVFDTVAALIAGLVIFPAIFSLGLAPDSGKNLLFVTTTNMFDMIPGGQILAFLFFLLIVFAALSSALGYLEPVVASFLESKFGLNRVQSVLVSAGLAFVIGIGPVLSDNVLKDVTILGMSVFDFDDFFSGNILMPLGAIIMSLYAMIVWKFANIEKDVNKGTTGGIRLWGWYKPFIMGIIPVALIIIFVSGVISVF